MEGIEKAVCFSTGMAAITTLFLTLLKSGDHIIRSDVVYCGTVRLVREILSNFSITTDFVNTALPEKVKTATNSKTKLILIKTPSNPLQKISDIATLAKLAHNNGVLLVVDNTFLSPWLHSHFCQAQTLLCILLLNI